MSVNVRETDEQHMKLVGLKKTTGDALHRIGYTAAFAQDGAQAIGMYRNAMQAGMPYPYIT